MTRRVVVVGGSVAGVRVAQDLRSLGWTGGVTLLEAEDRMPYDKPPLSKGGLEPGALPTALLDAQEVRDLDLDLRLGARATGLDLERRQVLLDAGDAVDFDVVVVATGAAARPSPWGAGEHVHLLRTADDAEAVRASLRPGASLLVVGAGFIGSEVAAAARAKDTQVTLVDPLPVPMGRIVGDDLGRRFADLHRVHGVDVRFGTGVEDLRDTGSGVHARLTDGTEVVADAAVVGIGVRPSTGWLDGSGLAIEDGVLCDATCRAPGRDDVYAVGDIARWHHRRHERDVRVEHWTNAVDQAAVVAHNIVRPDEPRTYEPVEYVWSDQYDWKIQLVGTPLPDVDPVVLESEEPFRLAAVYPGADGMVQGSVTVNWGRASLVVRRGLAQGLTVEEAIAGMERRPGRAPAR